MDKKKNFFCQVCNKAFRDNYKLKRHEKIHIKSGELVNPTEDCSYLEDEKPIHSGTFDLNSFHFVMKIIDGHMVKLYVKFIKYKKCKSERNWSQNFHCAK